jgi:hypothetical protein
MELIHQRITGAAMELYAMTAVISKLQSMIEQRESNGNSRHFDRDMIVGKSFCRNAARRIDRHLHGLFDNSDAALLRTADVVLGMSSFA